MASRLKKDGRSKKEQDESHCSNLANYYREESHPRVPVPRKRGTRVKSKSKITMHIAVTVSTTRVVVTENSGQSSSLEKGFIC